MMFSVQGRHDRPVPPEMCAPRHYATLAEAASPACARCGLRRVSAPHGPNYAACDGGRGPRPRLGCRRIYQKDAETKDGGGGLHGPLLGWPVAVPVGLGGFAGHRQRQRGFVLFAFSFLCFIIDI